MEREADSTSATRRALRMAPEDTGRRQVQRGRLKVYLGSVPGSGKTFAMLREGHDRRADGEDVVIGFVETHGRLRTQEAMGNLEVVPRVTVEYKGTTLTEMDLNSVMARKPQVALVDELAHTNAPGVRHLKRWQDVDDLLNAGIDVTTTVNIQHLESVKDLVERITGISVHETVPDIVVDAADELQFIDITPEALRKRMRHGNIYPFDRVETALRNFFREGNLAALREIALRRVADRLGAAQGGVRPAPEDVLVAVVDDEGADMLIRRGVRLARRAGGFCIVLDVGEAHEGSKWLKLADSLSSPVVLRYGPVAETIVAVARERGVRHVVVGEPRPQPRPLFRSNFVDKLVEHLTDVDLHVVARFSRLRASEGRMQERPTPESFLAHLPPSRRHGELRLYLGYAKGCGTTSAMLAEARRRKSRGTDVVVASLSTPDRSDCNVAAAPVGFLGGPNGPAARGRLDLAALLHRNPDVACVDDLAGLTLDGRPVWKVVPEIMAAGIVVIATLHLADLRSSVDALGHRLDPRGDRPIVEDDVLDAADEVELIDITPGDLEERLREGDLMPSADAARALQQEFRPDLLATMRELGFRRLASHTDRRLLRYMRSRSITEPWEVRPRVLVCVPPRPGMNRIIERASRLAHRRDDDLTAVTVRRKSRSDEEKRLLGGYAALTHQLGGEFVTLEGGGVAETIAAYARERLITEVIAVRGRGRRRARTLRRLVIRLADVDVHILSEDREG